jgi:D-serine dehydratase
MGDFSRMPFQAGLCVVIRVVDVAEHLGKGLPISLDTSNSNSRANLFDGTFPLPTAVLLGDALRHNIESMARYCAGRGVLLAPHAKTTMSPEIISLQMSAGAWAITVATAWQAGVVAGMGARRIILANELVDIGSILRIQQLLDRHHDLTLYCYVDSRAGITILEQALPRHVLDRLALLVELGVPHGRAGVRSDGDALDLARVLAARHLSLHGFAAFEGILDGGDEPATLRLVDDLLDRLGAVARTAQAEGLLATAEPMVTVGGSAYFDRVVEHLPVALGDARYRVVLRSGCYVSHDCGMYEAHSPFGARLPGTTSFRPALEVWAPVLSRPEPGRGIAGLGRRDISADAGLPVPLWVRSSTGELHAADRRWRAVAINDQHTYLDLPTDSSLQVGQVMGFGMSHPCTTFDKWRAIPIVDATYGITAIAHTHF